MTMLRLICLALLLATAGAPQAGDPVPPPPISGVLDVSIGGGHSCLLTALGGVRCWGLTADGRLGIGDGGGMLPSSLGEPQPIQVPPETVFTRLAVGNAHACALRDDGSVTCWGQNFQGQLGSGSVGGSSFSPVDVPGLSDVVELASGDRHTCALIEGGAVRCWGQGNLGQLGNADNGTADSGTPLQVTGLSGVV